MRGPQATPLHQRMLRAALLDAHVYEGVEADRSATDPARTVVLLSAVTAGIGWSTPGILRILAVIPPLAGTVFPISTLWMLVAMAVAVRQPLDYTGTGRAIAGSVLGFQICALLLAGPWPFSFGPNTRRFPREGLPVRCRARQWKP